MYTINIVLSSIINIKIPNILSIVILRMIFLKNDHPMLSAAVSINGLTFPFQCIYIPAMLVLERIFHLTFSAS